MTETATLAVDLFGCLHTWRRERGLPSRAALDLPREGVTGEELVDLLGLPRELVEAVMVNRKTYGLDHRVRPGDRVALVPRGIPGPHRFTLGIYSAGRGEGRREP